MIFFLEVNIDAYIIFKLKLINKFFCLNVLRGTILRQWAETGVETIPRGGYCIESRDCMHSNLLQPNKNKFVSRLMTC